MIATMTNNRRLIVIYGATGVGKTALSIALAQRLAAPIISCDSRQVFREMRIGTAVPCESELAAAEHHFIQDRSVRDGFSAGEFESEALALLDELFKVNENVILAGGSNLYINALLCGFDALPGDEGIRRMLNQKYKAELVDMLQELDPDYHKIVDLNNTARVKRALEVCLASGQKYSQLRTGRAKKRNFSVYKIGVFRTREELYERINRRVDIMVGEGLEEEARSVLPYRALPALQTVGYREFFEFFDGHISREQAIELIKQKTRNYAKRQLTWLRAEKMDYELNLSTDEQINIEEIICHLSQPLHTSHQQQ
ncbi:tRNA dimethylallyltransferase [Mucinivorans hirudinis]|uniref:tRNA dimethylallyltransferase n=1 Tax=Mucinivorans hirudinis TaxID=1433126 RepID=A0A060RD60_9BACT|nr:tRNA dimethylallyltransferase [Mucinivorans hirudinis]